MSHGKGNAIIYFLIFR